MSEDSSPESINSLEQWVPTEAEKAKIIELAAIVQAAQDRANEAAEGGDYDALDTFTNSVAAFTKTIRDTHRDYSLIALYHVCAGSGVSAAVASPKYFDTPRGDIEAFIRSLA